MTAGDAPNAKDLAISELQREAHALIAVLEREFQALTERQLTALESCADAKRAHLTNLERLARHPAVLALANDPADLAQRAQLNTLLSECQRRNDINGAMIEAGRRHTQSALNLLRGPQDSPEIYGARGETLSSPLPRSLARA